MNLPCIFIQTDRKRGVSKDLCMSSSLHNNIHRQGESLLKKMGSLWYVTKWEFPLENINVIVFNIFLYLGLLTNLFIPVFLMGISKVFKE